MAEIIPFPQTAIKVDDPKTWNVDLKEFTIKDLIEIGISIRDELDEQRKTYQKYEKAAKDMLLKIGMALKEHGDAQGVHSFATPEGTAYRNLKESYRVGDWNQVLEYIKESGNWQMLEKRIGKLATKELHETTIEMHEIDGKMVPVKVLPPGVIYVAEEVFVLRRPNERGSSDE